MILECGNSLSRTPVTQTGSGDSSSTFPLQFVKQIPFADARALVTEFHYLGKTKFRASFCFGCFLDNHLAGAIVFYSVSALETIVGAFGLPRTESKGVYEIGRLVLRPEFNGKNIGSFLISRSIKMLAKLTLLRAIITYAEAPRHTGAIYRASNFRYCGLAAAKNDFFVYGVKQERGKTKGVAGGQWRPRPRKHRFVRVLDSSLVLKWGEV